MVRYQRLTDRSILAGRLRAGWVGAGAFEKLLGTYTGGVDIVHPQKRFYAGGANSVRGWRLRELGPGVLEASEGAFVQGGDVKIELGLEARQGTVRIVGLHLRLQAATPLGRPSQLPIWAEAAFKTEISPPPPHNRRSPAVAGWSD